MKVIIEAPFSLSEQSRKGLEDKITDLEKYKMGITQASVFFKKDDSTLPDAIVAEIKLHLPGPVIFGSESKNDYMDAFNGALNKVDRQLRKAKDIKVDHYN